MSSNEAAPRSAPAPAGVVLLAAAALAAACSVGPGYEPPAPPEVASYTTPAPSERTAAAPVALGAAQRFVAGAPMDDGWWRRFGSPRLDELVERALAASPTLESAAARLAQAREIHAARSGSTRWPRATADAAATRQKIVPETMGLPAEARTFDVFHAGVAVSYDLDLVGGNRRALEALAAQVSYREQLLRGARLTLATNVVTTAIVRARIAEQIALQEETVALEAEQVEISRQRLALGAAAAAEVVALEAQLARTRAGLPALAEQLDRTDHLVAVLLGQPPGLAPLPAVRLDELALPEELPLSVPAELARRRPDILAAEALLEAAAAEHGVAVANLYPRLTLGGTASTQSLTASDLFAPGSLVWGLVAGLVQPLFDRGLPAEARAAAASYDAAAANYRETVVAALGQVADVLRALEHDAEALARWADADALAAESLDLTRRRHELGAASYLEILIANSAALAARSARVAAQAERLIDTAAFFQAIGAGAGSAAGVDAGVEAPPPAAGAPEEPAASAVRE